ncbi:MAG: metallophosphoesterase family protein [Anaerolineae bacterium]|nr:metallophosphoesterase family protein [Anaerolineae bacterium]
MRIAVISDMHGNLVAFDAVLADLTAHEAVDRVVCLGDAIQGGPQPADCVQRLRELDCPVVMGNADAWLLTGEETDPERPASQELIDVRAWSLSQLSDADKAFIGTFQPTITFPLNDKLNLLCFHGTPQSFDQLILPNMPQDEFEAMIKDYAANILTGGHTHTQQLRRIGAGHTFFFNPGSVGRAFSHNQPAGQFLYDPWADYAVLSAEGDRLSLEFRRVPFDVEQVKQIYRASSRPHSDVAISQYA